MTKRLDHSLVCAEDCRYRALYEGSQMSLTDLATRQAAALDRIGRVRAFLVALLKRERPTEFSAAEQQLGKRMSDVDDDVLLAYVDGLLTDEAPMLAALAAELENGGYNTRNARTLEGLIAAVRAGNENNQTRILTQPETDTARPKKPAVAAARPKTGNRRNQKARTGQSHTEPREPKQAKPSEPHTRNRKAGPGPAPSTNRDVDDAGAGAGGFASMFTAADAPDPEPKPDGVEVDNNDTDAGGLDNIFATANTSEPKPDAATGGDGDDNDTEAGGLGNIFATADTPDPEAKPDAATDDDAAAGGLDNIFATVDTPGPGTADDGDADAGTDVGGLDNIFATADTPDPDAATDATTDNDADAGGLDNIFATANTPDPEPAGETMRTVNTEQLKPELFRPAKQQNKQRRTTTKNPKPKVTPRTKATAADSAPAVVDGDSLHNKLLAAACIPRPVFIADLNELTGNTRTVAEWEQETRSKPDRGLRFVAAKQRHKLRGALVVPHDYARTATVEFTDSCWGNCLELYRGGRLYETGVLLHHLGDSVVTHQAGPDTVALRLNQRKGIVGMVVVVNDKLDKHGSTTRQLTADLDELVDERLFEIVVAVVNNEWYDTTRTIIEKAQQQHSWEPAMPVTLTRTWEYAAGVNKPTSIIN